MTTPTAPSAGALAPIQTEYKGYLFRSRLEARWAYYFDQCGIRWQYEAEGFTLSDGQRYLPDFWLPDYNQFVEVKPANEAVAFEGPPNCYGRRLTDIDEPGNHTIAHHQTLYVFIDDERTPLCTKTVDAVLQIQSQCHSTMIFLEPDHTDCCTYPDQISADQLRVVEWRNPTAILTYAAYKKWWLAWQARDHGAKHMVALADAQNANLGFRIVFGDPREMTQVCNLTTRELPYNPTAATAARQMRFAK